MLRKHPKHSPLSGSMKQTFTQGVTMGRPDTKSYLGDRAEAGKVTGTCQHYVIFI